MIVAQPLLDFLTGRAKSALPFLRASAARGESSAQAIANLKGLDLTFNRQRMLDVYGALLNRTSPDRWFRLVGETTPLPVEAHTVAVTNLSNNFQYLLHAENTVTGDDYYVTVGSEFPLSKVQILALGDSTFTAPTRSGVTTEDYSQSVVTVLELNQSPEIEG